jgi:flagellar motor switch/type III secretory pathway protein FliN
MSAPPDPVPYRLLGSSGRTRLQQRLEAATRRWLDTWKADNAVRSAVRLAGADDAPPQVRELLAESYRVRAGGVPMLDIRFYPRALCAVVGLPADGFSSTAVTSRPAGLAAQLSRALLRSFVNELMDSASIADWEFEELPRRAPASHAPRAPLQRAFVTAGDSEVAALELSPSLVNALAPAVAVPRKGAFQPRRGAIGEARVKVEAILGTVELSVADVMSLGRGDVIVLDARLGAGCEINVPRIAAVAEAVVGKRGGMRAVRIRRTEAARSP